MTRGSIEPALTPEIYSETSTSGRGAVTSNSTVESPEVRGTGGRAVTATG